MRVWCSSCNEEHNIADNASKEDVKRTLDETVQSMLTEQRDLLMNLTGEDMLRNSVTNLVKQTRALAMLWRQTSKRCRLCADDKACAHCFTDHLALNDIAREVLIAMAAMEAWLTLRGRGGRG